MRFLCAGRATYIVQSPNRYYWVAGCGTQQGLQPCVSGPFLALIGGLVGDIVTWSMQDPE